MTAPTCENSSYPQSKCAKEEITTATLIAPAATWQLVVSVLTGVGTALSRAAPAPWPATTETQSVGMGAIATVKQSLTTTALLQNSTKATALENVAMAS